MLQITKQEAMELNKIGVKFGENGISRSASGHNKYYVCENRDNLTKLNKIRRSKYGAV